MQPMIREAGDSRSLVDRMIGVTTLKHPYYRDIEADRDATGQALAVVALAAVAAGIGAIGSDQAGIVWKVIMAVVGWVVFSVVAFFVGSLLTNPRHPVSLGQVMRLVGFAQAPKLIGALAFIPLFGWIFGLAAAVWFLVVAIHALQEAFDVDMAKAALVGIVSLLVVGVVNFVVGTVFNIAGGILGWLF